MADNALLGILHEDGTVEAIYLHHGHEFHGVPYILSEEYLDLDKVRELINGGSLSILGPEIGHKVDFDSFTDSDRFGKQNLVYGRDRGDKRPNQFYQSSYDFFKELGNVNAVYLYEVETGWEGYKGSPNAPVTIMEDNKIIRRNLAVREPTRHLESVVSPRQDTAIGDMDVLRVEPAGIHPDQNIRLQKGQSPILDMDDYQESPGMRERFRRLKRYGSNGIVANGDVNIDFR